MKFFAIPGVWRQADFEILPRSKSLCFAGHTAPPPTPSTDIKLSVHSGPQHASPSADNISATTDTMPQTKRLA
jgi:hypothetical protein